MRHPTSPVPNLLTQHTPLLQQIMDPSPMQLDAHPMLPESRMYSIFHRLSEERIRLEIQNLHREHDDLTCTLESHHLDFPSATVSAFGPLRSVAQFALSPCCSAAMGVNEISPRVALTLLELIALRRNMIGSRRRMRSAPSTAALNTVLQSACRELLATSFVDGEDDRRWYALQQLRVLRQLHEKWARQEMSCEFAAAAEEEVVWDAMQSMRRRRKIFGRTGSIRGKIFKFVAAGSRSGRSYVRGRGNFERRMTVDMTMGGRQLCNWTGNEDEDIRQTTLGGGRDRVETPTSLSGGQDGNENDDRQ